MLAVGVFIGCAAGMANAQEGARPAATAGQGASESIQLPPLEKEPPAAAPPPKEVWHAPFGGTYSATFAFTTDYVFRGISQTERQVAGQMAFGYETAPVSENVPLTAYAGAWASNVHVTNFGATIEVDLLTGLRLKAFNERLTLDLGFGRYTFVGTPAERFHNFSEFSLMAGYDFGFAQLNAAVYHSPNFTADSGVAWYKWGQLVVPLRFIDINENVAVKLYGSLGNQYVEHFVRYDILRDNYWDWQIGLTVAIHGFNLTLAYVDTNLDVTECAGSMNCQARAVFTISKTF
jgi:uncharacterized protein (TIGR02001 family)